ncbi:MAG TPA: hypothetical protein VKI18_02670 [Albitalea sp.]|nr:hypothetical protein [Albitalea sp.]
MSFTVSASYIKASANDLKVLRPDPSATTWSRLEPLPTSDDVAASLQAALADPLWMLARQWQFNELQAEDAGSPVRAALSVLGLPVHSLLPMSGNAAPVLLDTGTPPIEALVEREQVLPKQPKLNAQAGQHLGRQLRAAGLGALLPAVLTAYPAALPAPDDAVADALGFVWNTLLDQRAVDALALAADLGPLIGNDVALAAFAGGFGAAGAEVTACADVLTRWLHWLGELTLDGSAPGASPYWDPKRLEYTFALGAGDPQSGARLEADEYTDGRLDWHTFTVAAAAQAPPNGPAFAAPEVQTHAWKRLLPALAGYPGMPADRFWEFEDGRVNFGMLGAAKSDLARVAVLEYALVFGNDWYVLPLTLPVNALYRVASFVVTDNFGIPVPIPPALNLDGTQWTMYEMSVRADSPVPRRRLDDILYLCPRVATLEGPPLEHVLMMRDEMANLVWGIEKRVQGSSGEPLDRKFESARLSTTQALRLPPEAVAVPDGAPLHYRLQTPVAANWIPFLPVRKGDVGVANWAIELQRGVVTHAYQVDPARLADPRNAAYADFIARLRAQVDFVEHRDPGGPPDNPLQDFMFHPRGSLLRLDPNAPVTADYLRLAEEEVPRDGIELERSFNYARDVQGRALLWIGRSKKTGRGEGHSGLKFDVIERGKR